MEAQKVDTFIMSYAKYFEPAHIPMIRERLLHADDSKWIMLQTMELKDPATILIVSILIGYLGIDRFMIGDTGIGVGKLLTGGACGIWYLIDLFMIHKATRQKNLEKLQMFI